MQVTINRTEPSSGGPSRTPRENVEPVFGRDDLVELDAAMDCSSSEGWPNSSSPEPGSPSTWEVQREAFRQFIAAAESLDSQAEGEQAGGSDDHGGIYTAGFNHGLVKIGAVQTDSAYVKGRAEDDEGDLNSSNFTKKMEAVRVPDENGFMVPLPYGGTSGMATVSYLDAHYLGEFETGDDGHAVPVAQRPKRARLVLTDGALKDFREFGLRLAEDHSGKWPQEEWFIAIFGYGPEHDKTLALYNEIAGKHSNVHVYSFDAVTNAAEIAEDMAVAVLATK